MKKIIVFAMLLASQILTAGNVICEDDQFKWISKFHQRRKATPPIYNPSGKIDPFQPIFSNEPTRRTPTVHQTDCVSNPVLERLDMSQLKLTGIVMTERQPIALVQNQEAAGKGHVIREGVCYGLRGGKIERILNDRLIVREEMQDATGRIQVKKIELKLKRR
jgi:Tfp pilus assembly protein PilP